MKRIRLPTRKEPLFPILSLPHNYQCSKPPKTLAMAVSHSNSKRPTCPSCSKPSSLCLCSRFLNPGLDNKVSLTILQHTLEQKHPLNSVRIAKLGLNNVEVVHVSDVNFGAQFLIRVPEPLDGLRSSDFAGVSDRNDFSLRKENVDELCLMDDAKEEAVIFFTIGKNGVITDLNSKWELQPGKKGPNFDQILASGVAMEALSRGFTVKKLQKNGSIHPEEHKEFEIGVPCGSILLFPSETAIGVEELQAMNIEVRNLIVLDGTWAKAKRVYNENPWLRVLPHLKLDLCQLSLYNEVRQQPRAGCLSTIESIVYALKALGDDNHDELDNLLKVFESMVEDQRRCKYERLKKSNHLSC
ncbi:DTW domain-containing protein [Euphorbia peplus]|nr:DTW domain-containing protein [Euphorbia peplus]